MNIHEEYRNQVQNVDMKIKRDNFDLYYKTLKKENLLILGIRQIGKSTISKQLAKTYIKDNNLSIDKYIVLDFRIEKMKKNYRRILLNQNSLKFVLIHEVQLLKNWNTELQSLIDLKKNVKFILTGSNSLQLRINNMVGRARQFVLKPLSWNEYKLFWDNDFQTYINYGSFPKRESMTSPVVQNSKLSEQVLKDVVREDLNNSINIDKFMLFSSNILNYIGSEVKVTKLPSDVGIENRTGKEYLDVLINAGVIKLVSNFYEKSLNSKVKKIYFTDSTLINYFNYFKEHNAKISGSLAENKVFNHLDQKYNKEFDDYSFNYFKNKKEVDFVLPKEKIAIEVKYSNDEDYLSEGIDNLEELMEQSYRKILITKSINRKDLETNIELISLENFLKNF